MHTVSRGIYTVLYKDNLDEFNTFIGNPFLDDPYNGIKEEVQTAVDNFLRSSYDNNNPMVVIEMVLSTNHYNHGVAFYFNYELVNKKEIKGWAWSFSEPVEPKEFIEELNHVVNIKLT